MNDLISKFKEQKCHFYFLTNSQGVLGLVSYTNLNCQAVYNYLYQVLADIERSIASVLEARLEQSLVIEYFKNSTDPHLKEVLKTFEEEIKSDAEISIYELFYLQTVGIVLKKFFIYLPDHLKKLNGYSSKFSSQGTYGQLRNKIMHPVRPILSDQRTIELMDELLTDYTAIKSILDIKDR